MTKPQMRYLAIWRGSYYYIDAMNLTGTEVMLTPMVTNRKKDRYAKISKWKSIVTRKFVLISRNAQVSVYNPDKHKWEIYEPW